MLVEIPYLINDDLLPLVSLGLRTHTTMGEIDNSYKTLLLESMKIQAYLDFLKLNPEKEYWWRDVIINVPKEPALVLLIQKYRMDQIQYRRTTSPLKLEIPTLLASSLNPSVWQELMQSSGQRFSDTVNNTTGLITRSNLS